MDKTSARKSLEEHVKSVVDQAPSLTGEQTTRLRQLLPPVRAIDDPVMLARAGKIVRGAMLREDPEVQKAERFLQHPAVIRARERGVL